ncbi:serine/threonine/tyrosine-interacting-like protein 1 [Chanos chanos]|uniref:Serine/threonine/tyrosine-interacting-like protein 1 n=1 Tax=Chanos chanos TaxID=29144 RepID=A0A6J2WXR5_CHACN|nr:serine/threonine/tyrosine-interacting-like protein 1 [Chanos chanos]
MTETVLCEPSELYNILNQYMRFSRLTETNYLCLIDIREEHEYNDGHIITARNVKWSSQGKHVMPFGVEIESMRYIVVYDSVTCSLQKTGPVTECADSLAKASRYPVKILAGGYEKFAALYPFLRTMKSVYTIRELESLKPYPVEILPKQLYMGDYKQATNPNMLRDLKLSALVNVSEESVLTFEKGNCAVLDIRVADSVKADLYTCFEQVCSFTDSHLRSGRAVLIFSRHGISRCSTLTMAFLIHHLKYSLKAAWEHVQDCKTNMRPNRGFVQQLSDWETHVLGSRITDTAEPSY